MSKKHQSLPIRAISETTSRLLERLPDWLEPEKLKLGKFGVANDSCIAIEIFRSTEAFKLGAEIGNDYGHITMSSVGTAKYLVFTEARASFCGECWYS